MAQDLIAITYFQYHAKLKNGSYLYHFHFIGPYAGIYLRKIIVESSQCYPLRPNGAYLLHLRCTKIQGPILYTQILRYKSLEDCSYL